MPPNEFTTELDKIKRERTRNAILPLVNGGENAYVDLAAALDQLSAGVRDEAALWEKHKKKGWQSTKTSLLSVAGKLNELGQELDRADAPPARRGVEPGGDPNQEGTAPRGNPGNFVYSRPVSKLTGSTDAVQVYTELAEHEPTDAEIAVHAERLAAEALAAPSADFDEPDADETGYIPLLSEAERRAIVARGFDPDAVLVQPRDADSQARTRAYLAGEINSLDAPLPTTTDTPIIDTIHQEARTMLEVRRAEAANGDPFTDPPAPGGYVFTDVEPITFEQLMTPAPVPAELKHWSYSQLSTLDECEVKYAGDKIFGKPRLPQWSLVGGRAFHAAVDIMERRILAPGSAPENWGTPAEIWSTAFQMQIDETVNETGILPQDWRAANGGKENYDWWRVEGEHMVMLYVEQRTKMIDVAVHAGVAPRRLFGLGNPAAPVLELELSIGVDGPMGNLEFKTIIDQAWLCHDGTLLIVDVKTGRQLPSAFDTFQLGSQAIVLAKHIGIQPPAPFVKACYYDARKGIYTTPIEALARHPMAELAYRMHTAEARRQAGIYRPYVSTRGCTGCGIRKLCPLMGGQ